MAVKMRLMRMGKKKQPMYRVVVIDGRSPRDGRYIEQIGRYAPLEDPSLVEIDNEKAAAWLSKGAQPTEAVEKLLNISGALNTMKVRTGQIHTVGTATSGGDEPVAAEEPVVAEEPTTEEVAADEANVDEVESAPAPADPGVATDTASDEASGEEE